MAAQKEEWSIAVYGALGANLVIAASKFVVAFITGSSALLSEGIHSLVDTSKELYFWSLIVALLLFSVGGGMSLYEGITHIEHLVEINDSGWNYVVLGISLIAAAIEFIKQENGEVIENLDVALAVIAEIADHYAEHTAATTLYTGADGQTGCH
jgi:divalent metal cation (Fe/Co/Zn/Cd) transporter